MTIQTATLIVKTIKLFIAQIFIKTMPHQIFLTLMFLLRSITLFLILLWTGNDRNIINIQQPVIVFVLLFCQIFTVLVVLSGIFITFRLYNKAKKINKKQEENYFSQLIEKFFVYSLLMYRIFLIQPMLFVAFAAINRISQQSQQTQSMIRGLAVSNLVMGLGVIYLLSGVGFWNKIGMRQDGMGYCSVVNTQSITYLFIPLIIVFRVFSWDIEPYIGIVYVITSIITVYIFPILTYNHNFIHSLGTNGVISTVCVLSFSILIDAQINTFGKYIAVLFTICVMTLALYQSQIKRTQRLLILKCEKSLNNPTDNPSSFTQQRKSSQESNHINWADSQFYYQNLLYHLINWRQFQNDLILHVISTLKYREKTSNPTMDTKDTKEIAKNNKMIQNQNHAHSISLKQHNQNTKEFQNQHQQNIANNHHPQSQSQNNKDILYQLIQKAQHQSNPLAKKVASIMSTLSQFQSVNQQNLYHQFCQLISQRLLLKCNLQRINEEKLGTRQLLKVLEQSLGYFILLLQSLMLESRNFTKAYLLIKLQQELLDQAQTSSFVQSIYCLAIVSIIDSHLNLQFKTHSSRYLPAQNYFQFQQKYQRLKTYIKQSADNKLFFWNQTNKPQPQQMKLKQSITKNYQLDMKILKHTRKITNAYPTSPLLLLSLIQSYTELALNTNMTSSKNTFNFLALQFHKIYSDKRNSYLHQNQLKQNQSKLLRSYSPSDKDHQKYNKSQNLHSQQENNPSYIQKTDSTSQNRNQIVEENANKYAVQKNISVFLIDLQSHEHNIEWANQYFWEKYTDSKKISQDSENQDNKQKQEKKDLNINDLIIPELRSIHSKLLYEFIREGSSLSYKHPETELFFSKDLIFTNVLMQFQLVPSLARGVKMMGFVHPVKNKNKQAIQIILRNDLTFVACTSSFLQHYGQFSNIKDRLNFQKDKNLAFDIILQNNIFGQYFNNIRMRQSGYKKQKSKKDLQNQDKQKIQQDNQSKINHDGIDYKVRLKKKIPYEGKCRDGIKDSQNQLKKCLLVFQLQKQQLINKSQCAIMETQQEVFTSMRKSKTHKQSLGPVADQLFLQTKNNSSPRSSKLTQSPKNSHLSLLKGSQQQFIMKGTKSPKIQRDSSKSSNKDQKDDLIMEDILIKEREKIQDKPAEIIELQKCYEILVSQRTPKNVKKWRIFTAVLLFLLMGAMICNMGFLTQRQNLYYENNSLATNYASLISDLSMTVATIRQYNFYAATYSTDRIEISFIVKKLVELSDIISKKVKILAAVLKKVWKAVEILPTGASIDVKDTSYVVISNYLLSSVTFASQIPSSNMSFPILIGVMYADKLTPTAAQISFLEAVFNGLYVAIPNLFIDRRQFIRTMKDNLLSSANMYFIYTCIGGSLCLLLFLLSSLILELKSQKIRSQTGGLLSSQFLNADQKFKKIQRLQKLKEILQTKKDERIAMPDWQDQHSKNSYFDILAKTLKDFDHNENKNHVHQEGQSDLALNAMMHKQQIIDDRTNREFMENQESLRSSSVVSSQENNFHQNTDKGMKTVELYQSVETMEKIKNLKPRKPVYVSKRQKGVNLELFSITKKNRFLLIIFYLLVCLPFYCYFIGILIGSISMNATIVKHIEITSQVENRKSYQQFVYLLTRETAYYEKYLEDRIGDWNGYVGQMISETYQSDRKTQKLITESQTSTNLRKKLAQLNHNNLCNYLAQFTPSTYFNITLSADQCSSMVNKIMQQGYKQLIVTFLQSSLQLTKNVPQPANLSLSQRVQYLQNDALKKMRKILAYSEQFIDQMVQAATKDMDQQIQQMRQLTIMLSLISIFGLLLFLIVARYQYQKLLLQRRQVQSIINLISIQTISSSSVSTSNQKQKIQTNQLIRMVQKIDWKFYQ